MSTDKLNKPGSMPGSVSSAAGSFSCLKTYLTASKSTNLAQGLVFPYSPSAPLLGGE